MEIIRETDPNKIDWIKVYQDGPQRNAIGWDLIAFGAEQFKRATIIQRLTVLLEAYQGLEQGVASGMEFREILDEVMWNQVVDDVRITLFFENCMKGILLFNGVMIHRFKKLDDEERFEKLNRAQNKNPLGIESISLSNIVGSELSGFTIGMNLMLSKPYQMLIDLPVELATIVRRINTRRNELHLHNSIRGELGTAILKDYEILEAFVDDWLHKREQKLVEWENANEKQEPH